jgi:hypothetical protein
VDNFAASTGTSLIMEDGSTETLMLTQVGQDLYRLDESSFLGDLKYHDVIKAEPQADGSLRLVGVSAPSEFRVLAWLLPEVLIDTTAVTSFLDNVMMVGGNWERTFGGLLTVHVPPSAESAIGEQARVALGSLPDETLSSD